MPAQLSPLAKLAALRKRADLIRAVLLPSSNHASSAIEAVTHSADAVELGLELSLIGNRDADDIARLKEKFQKQLTSIDSKITILERRDLGTISTNSDRYRTAQCEALLSELLGCINEIANRHAQVFGTRLARRSTRLFMYWELFCFLIIIYIIN